MTTLVDQLWFIEDQFNTFENVELKIPKKTKTKTFNPLKEWAENMGNQIGEFNINLKRKMIEDPMGESVMPILPHFIGSSEELMLQEIYAHLGE